MADFMGLMKQAAQLQSKMQALQAELEAIEVEGTAGGGMVSVKLSAKGDLKGVTVDDSLLKPSEKEILEDLLVAAHADARRKAETVLQDKMPRRAITMGVGTILECRRCLLLATGESKAKVIAQAVEGPITSMISATALQLHARATVIVDEEAAANLAEKDYYRWIFANEPEWEEYR